MISTDNKSMTLEKGGQRYTTIVLTAAGTPNKNTFYRFMAEKTESNTSTTVLARLYRRGVRGGRR